MKLPYTIKELMAFAFAAIIPSVTMGITFGVIKNVTIMLIAWPFSLLVSYLIMILFLRNPFTEMLKKKGMLVLDITSTGFLNFFLVKVAPPKIFGKYNGRIVEDMWDRNASIVMNLPSKSSSISYQDQNGNWNFRINNEDFQKSKMQLNQYPVLLYNSQINTFVTKEFFNDIENSSFANHPIIRLNDLAFDLSTRLRDFSRGVVDNLKAGTNIFQSKAGIVVVVIFVVIIIIALIMGGPSLIEGLKSSLGDAGGAVGTAVSGVKTITPMG